MKKAVTKMVKKLTRKKKSAVSEPPYFPTAMHRVRHMRGLTQDGQL